ncbi:MAG: hypothetical protein KDD45_13910 [Bdellovibrionales bacterium]|nr:hypothetical protein [Bdellovibrionales bacterium]
MLYNLIFKDEVHEIRWRQLELVKIEKDRLERLQLPLLYQDIPLRSRLNSRTPHLESKVAEDQSPTHHLRLPLEFRQQHRRYCSGVRFMPFRASDGALRIILSIFVALLWFPMSLYLFFLPYRVYMKEEESACVIYILHSAAIVFFAIWSIANFADANGWVMLAENVSNSRGAASFFTFFTALFSTIIAILSVVNVIKFCKREDDVEE